MAEGDSNTKIEACYDEIPVSVWNDAIHNARRIAEESARGTTLGTLESKTKAQGKGNAKSKTNTNTHTTTKTTMVWSSEPILDPSRYSVFRLDGHCFSSFVRNEKLAKPFDDHFSRCMRESAELLFDEFRFWRAFCGSDEITVVWQPLTEEQLSRGATLPFAGRTEKLVSLLAGFTSVAFYRAFAKEKNTAALPHFDCRWFQVATEADAMDALIERQGFTLKNARMMFAQTFLSQKQLNGVSSSEAVKRIKEVFFRDFDADVVAYNRIGGFLSRVDVECAFVIPAGRRKGDPITCTRSAAKWSFSWGGPNTGIDIPLCESRLESRSTPPQEAVKEAVIELPVSVAPSAATTTHISITDFSCSRCKTMIPVGRAHEPCERCERIFCTDCFDFGGCSECAEDVLCSECSQERHDLRNDPSYPGY